MPQVICVFSYFILNHDVFTTTSFKLITILNVEGKGALVKTALKYWKLKKYIFVVR